MNLARQLESYLPPPLLKLLQSISQEAARLGQKAYLVGGVVRDLFLGYTNFDLDLVVEGEAIVLAKHIAQGSEAKLLIHPRFGTAKLKWRDFALDLATARKETYARPGALPTVSPGSIEDDLFRRDFSINAMAISVSAANYGELIDPYGGKGDLDRGLIRILHPQSFSDDATRILRALRYEQRLGFRLETETARLLRRDIAMLDTISGDRIRHELELIFREKEPELVIRRLGELGALSQICPALRGDGWIARKFARARRLCKPGQLTSLYFCLLVYHLNPADLETLVHRLNTPSKLSRAMRDSLLLKAGLPSLDSPSLKNSQIYQLLSQYDPLAIQANAIATDSPVVRSHLSLFLNKLRLTKTALKGEDLKRLGIPPGPEMGKILQILHRAKLDGQVPTRADEERLVLSLRSSGIATCQPGPG